MWTIVPRTGWLIFCCVRACLSYSLLDRDPSRFLTAQVPSPELYFTPLMPLAKLVLWTDMIQNPEEYLQKELLLFKYFAFVCMYVSEHTCVFMWVFVQVCHKGQRTIFWELFLSFHHVGPGNQTHTVGLVHKSLSTLNHITNLKTISH